MTESESSDEIRHECFKCGEEIRRCTSAYNAWDEVFILSWTPASADENNIETSKSGGKHPQTETRRFCSRDCLDDFVQMDYSIKPESEDVEGNR